jgi:hypothetical protein
MISMRPAVLIGGPDRGAGAPARKGRAMGQAVVHLAIVGRDGERLRSGSPLPSERP